jgi:uncharacterized protein YegL
MPLGEGIAKRQLHFFFVCDCSGSMAYDGKIQALNQAIREATPEMQKVAAENPNAAVLVRLLIFSDDAVWHIAKPTPLEQFRLDNDLVAGGFTRLDRALDRLTEALSDPHLPERQLRPVILLVSDGQPSERWEKNLESLVATTWGGKAIRLAIGIGQDKDRDMLRKFIGNVEIDILEADSPQALVDRIKWASTQAMSVSSKSKAVNMSPIIAQAPSINDSGEWLD